VGFRESANVTVNFVQKNLQVINYKKFCWAQVFRFCMTVKFSKNKSYTYVFKVIVIKF